MAEKSWQDTISEWKGQGCSHNVETARWSKHKATQQHDPPYKRYYIFHSPVGENVKVFSPSAARAAISSADLKLATWCSSHATNKQYNDPQRQLIVFDWKQWLNITLHQRWEWASQHLWRCIDKACLIPPQSLLWYEIQLTTYHDSGVATVGLHYPMHVDDVVEALWQNKCMFKRRWMQPRNQ